MATRDSILDAALDVFSEKGYSQATFVDIAKRIGLTKGAVYWHFENKPALLAEVIRRMVARKEKLGLYELADAGSLEELRRCFTDRARVIVEDPPTRKFFFFLYFQMEWSEQLMTETRQKLHELVTAPFDNLKNCLQTLQEKGEIRGDVDLAQATTTLHSLMDGLTLAYIGGFHPINFIEDVKKGVDMVTAGMRSPEPRPGYVRQ